MKSSRPGKSSPASSLDTLTWFLQERAKELSCLYKVEEILNKPERDPADVFQGIIEAIPTGMQYPNLCRVEITIGDEIFQTPDYHAASRPLHVDICIQDKAVGTIKVVYTEERPAADLGPFLVDEVRLLQTIADRLGHFMLYQKMKKMHSQWETAREHLESKERAEWRILLDLLRQTDKNLYYKIVHKMLNHLCWIDVDEAKALIPSISPLLRSEGSGLASDENVPVKSAIYSKDELSEQTLRLASENLSDADILAFVQARIQEDKLSFLVRALNRHGSVTEVADAIARYYRMIPEGVELPKGARRGVQAALIRRVFSEQVHFVDIAKHYIDIDDFHLLLKRVIFPPDSRGKLGGKSSGMNIASHIIQKNAEGLLPFCDVRTPKTWYITSDGLQEFMDFNNFEEIVEQKYKEIDQVRQEYPNIVQSFKNGIFPPEVIKGLSVALDEFGDHPLIVRSSSLLEDQAGAAFSGKYKSLFLANQGTKEERMTALMDAIAEVYASVFGPDPIEYRAERGLLDFYEEMGIMIQEVVGTRVGDYFFPVFAGVAFSRNEFRWSPRIKREDGLLRLVPGLGTRAVDRVADDYPVLIAPGQPGLRVNVTVEETLRYSPRKIDVINLSTNSFETLDLDELLKTHGDSIPQVNMMVSLLQHQQLRMPISTHIDFAEESTLVTFEGFLRRTQFVQQMQNILRLLEERIGTPVDLEFAYDGKTLYLLQCRPQSQDDTSSQAAHIPADLPPEQVVFSARRHVSNGRVPDISYIVYVDPKAYAALPDRASLLAVGRLVGRLNRLLPRRQFILIGPGRWGSRGDIKLGVSVTYSDISNTALLVEVARKTGSYMPDLSFGTHFFQDLVEANIRYLPLYPDEDHCIFDEDFLLNSPSILNEVAPGFEELADTVRVIDVPRVRDGQIVQVLMNADIEQAVAVFAAPLTPVIPCHSHVTTEIVIDNATHWRQRMAERLASHMSPQRFGVVGMYIIGSVKRGTARPDSDIDLIVHFRGDDQQRQALLTWIEGWSISLDEMNYIRTGARTGGMIEVHLITDQDIADNSYYAEKIKGNADPARPLPIREL